MSSIGLGIITCNREDFYKECYESVPLDMVDELVTINDGNPYKFNSSEKFIQHESNKGVGVSKNEAMRYLLNKGCEHIFLIEDDIIITDKSVFEKYITTAKTTGVYHLMYGYHGPANKSPKSKEGVPSPRLIVEYSTDCSIALNEHCVGAFCYYHKDTLDEVGLMDETYVNAWEHVDHSYQLVKADVVPGYWWWPDVADSYKYLDEQACSEDSSAIRPRSDWKHNIQKGAMYFISKNGHSPVDIPDQSSQQITETLKRIKKNNKTNA
tara:strand:+ start:670 stop:1470 length:801 start_codon:yes stop_codon:yes gene_type:complete